MAKSRRPRARLWSVGGIGAVLALISVVPVFACTAIMGLFTITPATGAAGTVISTSAQGLIGRATYALHLTTATGSSTDCMSFTGVVTIKTIAANRKGSWSNVPATIPSSAALGTHGLCGMEMTPVKGQTGTTHDTFTVT